MYKDNSYKRASLNENIKRGGKISLWKLREKINKL